jgi:chromosome segregation ATPase
MPYDTARIDRLESAIEKLAERQQATADNIDKLSQVVNTLAESVVSHDDHIEKLLTLAEKHEHAITNLEKQWQAYLNTIHPKP